MAKDSDYEDILEDNVSDAKKEIRDMDDPDYSKLLEIEKENKDRKTVKEFLENKIDSQEVEMEDEEELVEEIEEETDSGLLGAYSRQSLVASALIFGLLVGLVAGLGASEFSTDDPQAAEDTIADLLEASGFEGEVTFADTQDQHGLFYVTVEVPQQTENGTTENQERSFYVTKDSELVFPEVQSPFIQSPINVDEALQQLEQSEGSETGSPTQNETQ